MASQTAAASIAYVDLATFSELESFLYGGTDAVTYFVRSVKKANWFSHLPIMLKSDQAAFNQKHTATINRSGDYLLNAWLRVRVPQIELDAATVFADATIAWTRNFMHNLIERVYLKFNELVVNEFDSVWFDFRHYFSFKGSKLVGYRNMIGDIDAMTTPVLPGVALGTGGWFNLPLPFFFSEESGVALPTAALPFNDITIEYSFRDWQDLLILNPGTAGGGGAAATYDNVYMTGMATTATPALTSSEVQTWAHYAVVHHDERVQMGKNPRDMLIYQVQEMSPRAMDAAAVGTLNAFNLKFSHSVVAIFYAARNISRRTNITTGADGPEWSNYTTEPAYAGVDPIATTAVVYENTARFGTMGSDYSSLVAPYYWAESIPEDTGLHMLSYSLKVWGLDPCGSSNYAKLASVEIQHTMSQAAVNAAAAAPVDADGNPILDYDGVTVFPQSWNHHVQVRNYNIGRVSGGAFGHPVI